MADGLNRVMLLGNLGADPEFRFTGNGNAALRLRIATSESYLDRNRVRQERTEWHSLIIWGKRAEALAKILQKGSRVFVEGNLRTSSYDDREGHKRYRTEVNVQNLILCGGTRAPANQGPRDTSNDYPAGEDEPADYSDDEIPF